jgi:hypothetical protein
MKLPLTGTTTSRNVFLILLAWLVLAVAGPGCQKRGPASPGGDVVRNPVAVILGLTGDVGQVHTAVEPARTIAGLAAGEPGRDIDLKRMAEWAMNYLIRTPRPEFDYEPVFQCYPLRCPPVPKGHDVVVACDTDARMNWEWYYMREVSGSRAGLDVEKAFHRRLLSYVQEDGSVLAHPGCYYEQEINRVYSKDEYYLHTWGATKILHALAEDFRRTGNEDSRTTAQKIMRRLKSLAVFVGTGQCYFTCGVGALRKDGSVVPNWWNRHPAPIVEPLLNYFLATGDREALDFARAYAEGIMAGIQPDGIRFGPDGGFGRPDAQSHSTMHALWGVAHLGLVTGETRYVDFVKRTWDYLLKCGTGTGWFPADEDNCNETCCISDMMSNAALIAHNGHPEYFDYLERYLRNYISNLQFVVTPEFEGYYRTLHVKAAEADIRNGLAELRKFQGGIIGGSGLNDWENDLLGGRLGFRMLGCCAPEGMRAVYTSWTNTIERIPESKLGPAGVYVNLGLGRESPWGRVVSYFPEAGRLTVKAGIEERYFLRPPHWAPRGEIRAFVGARAIPVAWSGDYVRFDKVRPGDEISITYPLVAFTHEVRGLWKQRPQLSLKFEWLGNMVVRVDPPPAKTPLFTGQPRLLPPPPRL